MVYSHLHMRLILLLALVAVILGIVALAIPASILFSGVLASGIGWLAVGVALYFLDLLLGGWSVPVGTVRRVP